MVSYKKSIALMLSVLLFVTMTFTGCESKLGESVKDFFSGIFKKSETHSVTEEVRLPDRPYIIDEGQGEPGKVSEVLVKPELDTTEILAEPSLEEQILSAGSLEELADSKTEVDNLREFRSELKSMYEHMQDDEDAEQSVKDKIVELKDKIDFLFSDGILPVKPPESATAIKGTWAKPDKVILRWSPQVDWVPEEGYDLYRVIDGETELISGGMGTLDNISLSLSPDKEFSEYILPMFENSRATDDVLEAAGVGSIKEFNEYLVSVKMPVVSKYRFSGEEDFEISRFEKFSIKGNLADRIPSAETIETGSLVLKSDIKALPLSISFVKTYGLKETTVKPIETGPVISDLVVQVMQSRNDLITKANVDIEFANTAGLGYEDDLSKKDIELHEMIEYILVPKKPELMSVELAVIAAGNRPEGTYSTEVEYGVETPIETPEELMGYGSDNAVYLRWTPPVDTYAKSIISGYYIERKKNKESKYTVLNDVPVVIPYMTDEDGILYELPVFYTDLDISNYDTAVYRIRAVDIFGRLSEYTNELEVTVYKVTPPNTPNVDQPILSTGSLRRTGEYIKETADLNSGKTGIILPISKTSPDTKQFAVFRSKALGNGSFDDPVEVARIPVEEPKNVSDTKKIVKYNNVKLLVNPSAKEEVHTVYFDENISEGNYYKYWVAAVDEAGNESPWSSGRVAGYPTQAAPQKPYDSKADMKRNTLPEKVIDVPGFSTDRLIDYGSDDEQEAPKTEFALQAKVKNVSIGVSLSEIAKKETQLLPGIISFEFDNLPEPSDIHTVVALQNSDLLPGATARVSWYHYSGEGLGGYHVYRAYIDGSTIEELQEMSREDLVKAFSWEKAGENIQQNLLMETVDQSPGRIYLYLVFLVPEEKENDDTQFQGAFNLFEPGGWVYLNWKKPDEPQLSYYRVYRAEVPFFKEGEDLDALEWTMVADNHKYTGYSEKVDQTFAHYYYYKITTVSVWGLESEDGDITSIRVPATSPPQTPSMLIPFAQKGKVNIQWVGVAHASKYILYKQKLPKIEEEDISELRTISPDLFSKVFTPVTLNDTFISERMFTGLTDSSKTTSITQNTIIPFVNKFNTLQLDSKKTVVGKISQIASVDKLDIYKNIVDKYGVLAVAPYGQLDIDMAKLVIWEKVTEVDIPLGEASTGVFDYTDEDVLFGDTYLYTVQAANDDELYSGRPDPVTVSPRKSSPFPPVTGLKGSINELAGDKPELTWNTAKEPNLSWKESREYIAGYIVYKSNSQNGPYYQASALLTEASFIDRDADAYAANWYKVRVVDTGGFISDYSEAVKVQKPALFLIPKTSIKKIAPLPILNFNSTNGDTLELSPLTFQIAPIKPITPIIPLIPSTLTINGFTVTELSADTVKNGSGDGKLKIGEKFAVDVSVVISSREGTVIKQGSVALKQPVAFEDTGVYFRQLSINTSKTGAYVSGYVKNINDDKNLLGDVYAFTFENAVMNTAAVISIENVPMFHYDNLTFKGAELATINLGQISQSEPETKTKSINIRLMPILVYGSSFITLFNGIVENNLGMETLDNKGLKMTYGMMGFDEEGKLRGVMSADEVQTVRTVVPAGLGIRVASAKLVYTDGAADPSKSFISGKILLPFETFEDYLPVEFDPDLFIKTYSDKKVVMTDMTLHTKILGSAVNTISLDTAQKGIVDRGMYYLASRIQSSALKVLPMDISVQEKLSTVPFAISAWGGKGFLMQDTTMTPALVGNADEEIGVTPGRVALDLTREEAYTGEAPDDTKDADWMGIVVKNGRVGLPPAFIKTDDDSRVMFDLTPGELLYDRNGVFYQNQAYSEEGIPVNFGDSLGGFRDVIVNLIFLDMYNNKVNLEIHGEVGIPLFGYQRAKVRLYTSKELGKLVCSVAETEKFDPSGKGNIFIKILGGHLQPDGLHMDGTIDLVFEDKLVKEDMQFTELVVPSDMEMMTLEGNAEELYGRALFDKPYRISFHDFEMDVRALSMDSVKQNLQIAALKPLTVNGFKRDLTLQGQTPSVTATIPFYITDLTLWGGMQLSDNLAMDNNEDFDRVVIASVFNAPAISYEESKSKLEMDFEGFASVKTVAVPVLSESDDGIIEYNTDTLEMVFNSANDLLAAVPVEANVRLGYDKTMGRYFFALGIYYHDPAGGIQFGFGTLNDITGVIGYNLDLPYDSESGFSFPNSKNGFFNSIDDLEVNRTPGGNYFLAATAWMYLGYDTGYGKLKLGEIRNIYMVVEKGPTVEMGGDYYGPSTVQSIMTGNDLKLMGTARLGYYHRERLFKFSLSLYDFGMYGCTVNGDLGFEMSPKYWEMRIGYPEMLTAKMGAFTGGFGFTMRYSDFPDDSFIKARMHFGYDTGDITIWPVYFRAYLFAGGGGEYYFDSGNLVLTVYIEGGLEGGIKVSGKKYRIIHMMVGADGTLTRYYGNWNLDANVRIRYHLDLFLFDVSGSVKWHVSKDF